jgi:uncharacterized protein with PQ loop repeat
MTSQDSHGLHHFHKRKRRRELDKWKQLMDRLIYGVVFGAPLLTIPQVTKIWIEKNAASVSVISWSAYLIAAIFWLVYALVHKEKPLIISSIIWIFLDLLIVVGVVVYG